MFDRAGVPGVQQQPVFDRGGLMPQVSSRGEINIFFDEVTLAMSDDDATQIFTRGGSTRDGRAVTLRTMRAARRMREF